VGRSSGRADGGRPCPGSIHLHGRFSLEPSDNKQLALLKAISSHEQAAAALTDLTDGMPAEIYAAMLGRIEENITDLKRVMADSKPADHV
jgi:hypothetical protein